MFQETWLSLIRSASEPEGRASFRTWLYQIGRNRLIDHWRRNGVLRHMADDTIAIDIDGTLVVPEQDVTPRVKRAVAAARERGVLVMLATGRRFDSAQEFALALELDGPMIVSGGAMVCNAASGEISGFAINPTSGALTHVETQGGLPASAGIQGIAARDF